MCVILFRFLYEIVFLSKTCYCFIFLKILPEEETRLDTCISRAKRETGRHAIHTALAKNMWQSAVDTLVMALGRRDEIGDAIRCISADEGCNLAQTPFIKVASLPWQIQGYCCQHGQLPCNLEQPGLYLCLSLLIRFYASLFYFILHFIQLIYQSRNHSLNLHYTD